MFRNGISPFILVPIVLVGLLIVCKLAPTVIRKVDLAISRSSKQTNRRPPQNNWQFKKLYLFKGQYERIVKIHLNDRFTVDTDDKKDKKHIWVYAGFNLPKRPWLISGARNMSKPYEVFEGSNNLPPAKASLYLYYNGKKEGITVFVRTEPNAGKCLVKDNPNFSNLDRTNHLSWHVDATKRYYR